MHRKWDVRWIHVQIKTSGLIICYIITLEPKKKLNTDSLKTKRGNTY